MIDLENRFVDLHNLKGHDFVEHLVAEHAARGRIDPQEITKAIELHLEGVSVVGSDFLQKSLESLHHHSRGDALNRAGFGREVRRAKIAQTDEERNELLRQSFDMAFRSVNSLPTDIIERIRQKIQDNLDLGRGTTDQVLRSLIEEEIQGVDIDDPDDLRAAVRRIWEKTKPDLQRVIRSEAINAYSRVQLQEWADRGIKRVRRRSIDDDRTCPTCSELSKPGANVYDITDLLALDYPVTQDPATGDWLTHPNCRCFVDGQYRVYTTHGWIAMKDIKVGDLVLTHRGRFRRVTEIKNHHRWKKGQPLVEVIVRRSWRSGDKGGRSVKLLVTPDHPFLTRSGWRLASEIGLEDRLVLLAKRCKCCKKKYPWFHFSDEENYCSQACSSKSVIPGTWTDERRENMSLKACAQMRREDRKRAWTRRKLSELTVAGRRAARGKRPSRPQIELYGRIAVDYADAVLEHEVITSVTTRHIDVAIPSLKIAVEYDGAYWHQDPKRDAERDAELEQEGWTVLHAVEGKNFDLSEIRRIADNHMQRYEFTTLFPVSVKKRTLRRTRQLWNLEVADDHSYVAHGIVSHNCWFEPVVDDVWDELEGLEAELLADISRGQALASDVPIDAQRSVDKALKEHSELDLNVRFVPRIVDMEIWQTSRLTELSQEMPSFRAQGLIQSEIALNAVTEWTDPETGAHYVASQSQELDHASAPVARAGGSQIWDTVDQKFVVDRYKEKKEAVSATVEIEGYQVFGGEPFPNEIAAQSAKDYFVESYSLYLVQPYVLQTVDPEMYDWLSREVFGGREFLQRGGLK